ncbi:hypothetical protein DJ017_11865 [Phenylobacterium soli]|uniref:Aminoglycoside (3'') (9) adenylyltransferase n=2 Tax=Phenylobacterium soli TaxID=2170551 RepID=A0A328AMF6_9CAUL|nr:hypothetical protein DJ017_11865 [Phenylobacterium soli]
MLRRLDLNMTQRTRALRRTLFADLNAVLEHLVEGARALLGDNFLGVYLQGSFGVGGADRYSDCDFVIVTHRDITPSELPAFQAFHAGIHRLPQVAWRNQLEGSYAPAAILRRWSPEPRDPPGEPRAADWADPGTSGTPPRAYPFWYLDHGSDRLVRSEHDNTQVVRWCLRERGVTLAGPEPREIIDPVTPAMLRAEVRQTMDLCLSVGLEPMHMAAWQVFWVGLFCRILHTLETGRVTSKHEATDWAMAHLDGRWRELIGRAQALRKGMAEAWAPTDPAEAATTRAFARYAVEWADARLRGEGADFDT